MFVSSDSTRIFLQSRHSPSTEQDILTRFSRVEVPLTEVEALTLASDLLSIVASRRGFQPASQDEEPE